MPTGNSAKGHQSILFCRRAENTFENAVVVKRETRRNAANPYWKICGHSLGSKRDRQPSGRVRRRHAVGGCYRERGIVSGPGGETFGTCDAAGEKTTQISE